MLLGDTEQVPGVEALYSLPMQVVQSEHPLCGIEGMITGFAQSVPGTAVQGAGTQANDASHPILVEVASEVNKNVRHPLESPDSILVHDMPGPLRFASGELLVSIPLKIIKWSLKLEEKEKKVTDRYCPGIEGQKVASPYSLFE